MGGKRERPVGEPLQHVGLCSAQFPPPSLLLHADAEQADRSSAAPLLCARSLPAAVELEEEAVAVGNAAEKRKRVV